MSLRVDSSSGSLQQLNEATSALRSIQPGDRELRDKVVSALANVDITPAGSAARPMAGTITEEERREVHDRVQRLWDSAVAAPGPEKQTVLEGFRERMVALNNPLGLNFGGPEAAEVQVVEQPLQGGPSTSPLQEVGKQKSILANALEGSYQSIKGNAGKALSFSLTPAALLLDIVAEMIRDEAGPLFAIILFPIILAAAVLGLAASPLVFIPIQGMAMIKNRRRAELETVIERCTTTEEIVSHWKDVFSLSGTEKQKESISSLGPNFAAKLLKNSGAKAAIISKFGSFERREMGHRTCSEAQLILLRAGGHEFRRELAQSSDPEIKSLCEVLEVVDDRNASPEQLQKALEMAYGRSLCDPIIPSQEENFCRCQPLDDIRKSKWAVPYPDKWLSFWDRISEGTQRVLLESIAPPRAYQDPEEQTFFKYVPLFSPTDTKCSKQQMLLLMSPGIGEGFREAVKRRAPQFSALCDAVGVMRNLNSRLEDRLRAWSRINKDRTFSEPFVTIYPNPEELPPTPQTDLRSNPFV